MSVNALQREVLRYLADNPGRSPLEVANACNTTLGGAHRRLDALYRRSLVFMSDDGRRWYVTDRGEKKAAA